MISGGDVLEWPIELQSDKEMEMEQEKEFDEAMWERTLEQEPPQDDDITWLKSRASLLGWAIGLAEGEGKIGRDKAEERFTALEAL